MNRTELDPPILQTQRRRAKRRRRKFPWAPGLRKAAWIVIVGFILARLAVTGATPYLTRLRVSRETEQCQRKLDAVRKENERLQSEVSFLSSPNGLEAEARRMGYVRKGEIALIMTPEPVAP